MLDDRWALFARECAERGLRDESFIDFCPNVTMNAITVARVMLAICLQSRLLWDADALSNMEHESPVTIHQILNRGAVAYKLKWTESGMEHEKSFPLEAEAVMEMSVIEERLRVGAMAGQGLTVNPFGMHVPFINSKDVHFAALKLQPRGLKFRESIEDYVAAVSVLKALNKTVAGAVAEFVEASQSLKPYDVSVEQAIFEWLELKKQIGDHPLYEMLRPYLKMKAAAEAEKSSESAGAIESPAPPPGAV